MELKIDLNSMPDATLDLLFDATNVIREAFGDPLATRLSDLATNEEACRLNVCNGPHFSPMTSTRSFSPDLSDSFQV